MLKKLFLDLFKTVLMLVIAYKMSDILLNYTGAENNSALVFVMAVMVISTITSSYFWGSVASIVSAFCINFFFMYPKYSLTIYF